MNPSDPTPDRLPHLLLVAPRAEVREAILAPDRHWRVTERSGIAEAAASPGIGIDLLILPEGTSAAGAAELVHVHAVHGRAPCLLQLVSSSAELGAALSSGADDAVVIPCPPDELCARVERLVGSASGDATERELGSEPGALARELRLRRVILDALGEGVLAMDAHHGLQFLNPAALRILGYAPGEVSGLGPRLHAQLHGRREDGTEIPYSECRFVRVLETGEPLIGAVEPFTRRDGSVVLTRSRAFPIIEHGKATGVVISFTDITEERRAEQELRRLERALAKVQVSERRQLAHDLHDSVGQTLTLVKLSLSLDNDERVRKNVLPLIDQCIRQVRSLSFELHPEMLDELGLIPTLRLFLEDFCRRTGLRVEVTEHGNAPPMPPHLSSYVYRAVKELLNNVAKHAQAHEALVHFHWGPARLRVVVDDDGVGMVERGEAAPRSGLGLETIRSWLRQRGGKLLIDASAGQGTRAAIEVPLDLEPL